MMGLTAAPGFSGRVHLRAKVVQSAWLVGEDAPKQWMHLTIEGAYKGHQMGEFEFTREVHAEIIRNFDRDPNPIPVTLGHDGEQETPAYGWIHQLELRKHDGKEGLWGLVEFTERAAEWVRAGNVKFCSVEVDFDARDAVTGKPIKSELFGCAFTNKPFLRGQAPLHLSRVTRSTNRRLNMAIDSADMLARVRDALGLEDDATLEQITQAASAIDQLQQASTKPKANNTPVEEQAKGDGALDVAASNEPQQELDLSADADTAKLEEAPAEEEEAAPMGGEMEAVVAALAEALSMDPAEVMALMAQKLEDIAQVLAGAPEDGMPADEQMAASKTVQDAADARMRALSKQVSNKDAEIAKLKEEVGELLIAADNKRLDDAIRLGHVLAADRDKFTKLARSDRKLFDEWLDGAADEPAVPTGTIAAGRGSVDVKRLSVDGATKDSEIYQVYERQLQHIKDPERRDEIIRGRIRAIQDKEIGNA